MHSSTKQNDFLSHFEPLRERLYRFVWSLTREDEEARDLFGDTVLEAYRRFEGLQDRQAFLSYCFSIAFRLQSRRRKRHSLFGEFDPAAAERIADTGPAPDMAADLVQLRRALASLPAAQREAIALFDIAGMSLNEVSRVQGCSLSGVKSRLRRGRARLAVLLGAHDDLSSEYESEEEHSSAGRHARGSLAILTGIVTATRRSYSQTKASMKTTKRQLSEFINQARELPSQVSRSETEAMLQRTGKGDSTRGFRNVKKGVRIMMLSGATLITALLGLSLSTTYFEQEAPDTRPAEKIQDGVIPVDSFADEPNRAAKTPAPPAERSEGIRQDEIKESEVPVRNSTTDETIVAEGQTTTTDLTSTAPSERYSVAGTRLLTLSREELQALDVVHSGTEACYFYDLALDLNDPKVQEALEFYGETLDDGHVIMKSCVFMNGVGSDRASDKEREQNSITQLLPVLMSSYNKGRLMAQAWNDKLYPNSHKLAEDVSANANQLDPEQPEDAAVAQNAEAQSLLQQLAAGADFADLARKFSKDPASAGRGGELGWVKRGIFDAEFEDQVFALDVDEVSSPLRSAMGLHIVQVVEKRDDAVKLRHILLMGDEAAGNREAVARDAADQPMVFVTREEDSSLQFIYRNIQNLIPIHFRLLDPDNSHFREIDVILWYPPSEELATALPPAFAKQVRRELDILQKLDNENVDVQRIDKYAPGDSRIMNIWRSSAGALVASAVSPNPVIEQAELSFELEEARSLTITLHSIFGDYLQEVGRGEFGPGEHRIPLLLNDVSSGVFLLAISSNRDERVIQRVVLQR